MHALVSLWTGLATLNYTANVFNPANTIYLDWIITTPLLILSLSLTAGKGQVRSPGKTLFSIIAQAGVIFTGYLAAATGDPLYFFIGSALFLAVIYNMVWEVGREADAQYRITAATFFLLWSGYPVLFYLGILNNQIPENTLNIGLVVLPLISKHLYGLYDMTMLKK